MTSLQTAATSYNRALLKFSPYSFIAAIKNVSPKYKSMHSIEVTHHQGSSNKAAKALQGQQQKTRVTSTATLSSAVTGCNTQLVHDSPQSIHTTSCSSQGFPSALCRDLSLQQRITSGTGGETQGHHQSSSNSYGFAIELI